MASFLSPRAIASSTSLTNSLRRPTRPFLRCLHSTTPTTRHHRRPAIPSSTPSTTPTLHTPSTHPSARRTYKTVEEARSKAHSGPFSIRSAILFLTAGGCMIVYFRFEKDRIQRQKIAEAAKGVGKPKVGGKFELVDQMGRVWTEASLKGGFTLVSSWLLKGGSRGTDGVVYIEKKKKKKLTLSCPGMKQVYFGFSHCPDICPDELDKMAKMIDLINGPPTSATVPIPPPNPPSPSTSPDPTSSPTTINPLQTQRPPLLPIFITCDPARDTPSVLGTYLREFHPSLVGLTGTWQQVKDVCRAYRVYFSTPEGAKPGDDYLVDHSIYFYLMDPDGDFVECLGRQHTPESAAKIIREHMSDWRDGKKVI